MLVSIASYDICDGTLSGGVAISDLRAVLDRIFDIVTPISTGSGSGPCGQSGWLPVAYDRLITKCDFSFMVKRVHADLAASDAFILGLECTLPRRGTVVLTGDSATLTISDGCLVSHALQQQIGATTFHSYHIIGSGTITLT